MDREIFGNKMRISVDVENGNKIINVLPWPERRDEFLLSTKVIDEDSLQILWSKHYFGINHRTQMFMVLYNTFVETLKKNLPFVKKHKESEVF
ncbi:hypothetical protein ACFY5J_24600 [Peribacillus butanolivorans]|uniref:hypothetical protein n=1 Tax=Peribacillus butanolivorans TaxID=421767 RepID=UPI0036C3B988